MEKFFEGCKITNSASPRSRLKHQRTCVILSLMKTLNTDLSDQERLNSFLWCAQGILNHSLKAHLVKKKGRGESYKQCHLNI